MTNIREISRQQWDGNVTREDIELGCKLRIADAAEAMAAATEKMTVNHDRLMHDRDMYKRMHEAARETIQGQNNSIRNLKGQITKMRRKIESMQIAQEGS